MEKNQSKSLKKETTCPQGLSPKYSRTPLLHCKESKRHSVNCEKLQQNPAFTLQGQISPVFYTNNFSFLKIKKCVLNFGDNLI